MTSRACALITLAVLTNCLQAADRPQFGEAWSRNMTSPEVNLPATFNPTNGTHIRWSVPLGASGTESHSTPVVARGRIFIGTNNELPRDARRKGDRGVKAIDLYGNHRQCFGLRRVHLPRHDGGAGLILWNAQLTESGARSGGEPAHIIGELHQRSCECAQRCGEVERWLLSCECCELIRRAGKWLCGEECDLLRCTNRKLWVAVETSANRSSAECEREQAVTRAFNALNVSGECCSMRAEFLSKRQWHRIL
jgi:hypothetical protein